MEKLQISRNGETDQFSVVISRGDDTIRCMVSVAAGHGENTQSDEDKERAALSKAKALAKALDDAIQAD
ncbi:hypothetical protein [Hyphococcus luteus]|uniref:Uncharacterized protein n=1 Tax=Hyphococcus luteus TaxID=2058213 RepID=A0A2S7K3Q8_9PROT|nr:hypothetical protein [Marinicaulis flavus]PQA87140.1 hypothetical protein CW354_13950 [Marinicaulis flavus]